MNIPNYSGNNTTKKWIANNQPRFEKEIKSTQVLSSQLEDLMLEFNKQGFVTIRTVKDGFQRGQQRLVLNYI